MKIQNGMMMAAPMVLTGCQSPPPAAPAKAATASSDASQVAATDAPAKKKCEPTTGSRMRTCDGAGADVQGSSGDDYRASMLQNQSALGRPH